MSIVVRITVAVEQTGIGVTVVGLASKNKLKIGLSEPNDLLIAVGYPHVKNEVLPAEERGEIADLKDLVNLIGCDFAHDVIPVGSQGIIHEVKVLGDDSCLIAKLVENPQVNIHVPAGPATVILVTTSKNDLKKVSGLVDKPVTVIGSFFKK